MTVKLQNRAFPAPVDADSEHPGLLRPPNQGRPASWLRVVLILSDEEVKKHLEAQICKC